MKTFNLNDYVLVSPTKYGIESAIKEVGQNYWDTCVLPKKEIIEEVVYYKIQAHEIITLWGNALWAANPCPINMNILIPE